MSVILLDIPQLFLLASHSHLQFGRKTHNKEQADIPVLPDGLCNAATPTIIVSSKCDNPPVSWQVSREKVETVSNRFDGLECFQTTKNAPETHKRCISVILRAIALRRLGKRFKVIDEPWMSTIAVFSLS